MATLKLVNWNVNGLRAICKKDFIKDIKTLNPDILCLQETKASPEDVKSLCELLPEFKVFVNSSKARKGYSGTAILTKVPPITVGYDLTIEEHDQEGRVITAEFEKFSLVTVYAPNSGDGLKRLDYREKWDADFTGYIRTLKTKKAVIIAGDLNVAHQAIDIARARENYNKSSGYTQKEIDGFNRLLNEGFIDTFRHLYPSEIKFSYWNQMFNARARNIGWRIDYFLISEQLLPYLEEANIYNEYFGSDHCPIGLSVNFGQFGD